MTQRYTIDTARDSVDWTRIHYIVRDNLTNRLRSFDTRALAEAWIASHTE